MLPFGRSLKTLESMQQGCHAMLVLSKQTRQTADCRRVSQEDAAKVEERYQKSKMVGQQHTDLLVQLANEVGVGVAGNMLRHTLCATTGTFYFTPLNVHSPCLVVGALHHEARGRDVRGELGGVCLPTVTHIMRATNAPGCYLCDAGEQKL